MVRLIILLVFASCAEYQCEGTFCDQKAVQDSIEGVEPSYIELGVNFISEGDLPDGIIDSLNSISDSIQYRLDTVVRFDFSTDLNGYYNSFGLWDVPVFDGISVYFVDSYTNLLGFAKMPSFDFDSLRFAECNMAFVAYNQTDLELSNTVKHEIGHLNSLDHKFRDCKNVMSYCCSNECEYDSLQADQMIRFNIKYR